MKGTSDYPRIRWMIRNDMPEVLAIEFASFEFPWTELQFLQCMRERNCIGMVAVDSSEKAIGFMLYELHRSRLHVLNFAVSPRCRHQGIGRLMIENLFSKISPNRRKRIQLEIRESNLGAQLFFKAMGFRCVKTIPNYYEDVSEDAYLFQFHVNQLARMERA